MTERTTTADGRTLGPCWVKSPHKEHRVQGYPYWTCPGVAGKEEPNE